MSALSRRDLLVFMALAGVAVLPARAHGLDSMSGLRDLTRWLGDEALLAGQRYLQLHTAEADLDVLTGLLAERLHGATGSDLPRDLARAVEEDFRRGDVIPIDDWVLSRTEVRLCAVASLAQHAV